MSPEASPKWPEAVETLNPNGRAVVVLLCPHASNHIPAQYQSLGLSCADLQRHIAWDIGAAGVTRHLSELIDAPAFLGTYSRLLIDLNRSLRLSSSIVLRSEDTDIPGNAVVTAHERACRIGRIFRPFHAAVSAHLARRDEYQRRAIVVAIHSFTPVFHGVARPWHAGVLFDKSAPFARATINRLQAAEPTLNVGANVPYSVTPDEDFCLWQYADSVGKSGVEIEIRQDLIASPEDQRGWAQRLAKTLALDVA